MSEKQYITKQYKKRWINLFLFVIYAINNGIHWTQYSVINNSITSYYHVSPFYVEWTAGLFTLNYVLFVVPGLYLMEKIKMRYLLIFVSCLSTIGAWIKVCSVLPDRFLLAFIGQCLISISYTFTFGVSARLIATWFGVHESSRASALSLFGDQCGGSASFLVTTLMVPENPDLTIWENSLKKMHIANASMSTLFLALIILLFKDKPKNPPSMVQALNVEINREPFIQSLRHILKKRAFLMLLFWYSINAGLMNTLGIVIGEIITINFKESNGHAGKIGFIMTAIAMLSSPIFGYFMDKTHKFKESGIILSTGSFISFLIFTIVLKLNNIVFVYITAVFLGIFMASTYVSGIQIGIEILYPIPEDKCSAMMAFVMQLTSVIFLPIYSIVLRQYGDTTANIIFCILTLAGSVVACFTPIKLKRQEAECNANAKELKEFLRKPQIVKHELTKSSYTT